MKNQQTKSNLKFWAAIPILAAPILAILTGAVSSSKNGFGAHPSPLAPQPSLPFKLEVVEVKNSTLPPLHSFGCAVSGGKWLVFGGRVAGLHGFGSTPNNFPRESANLYAYVIDPAANKVLGKANLQQGLSPAMASSLTSTNQQCTQVGPELYVVGGYGKNLQSGKNETIGSLICVDVPGVMAAIVAGKSIQTFFTQSQVPDQRLKVSGGDLTYANNVFYLVFGQDFDGDYSVQNKDYNHAGGQFQKYTEKVRAFTINKSNLSIATYHEFDGGYNPSLPYHRRDLNVTEIIGADGVTPKAVAYGGVFLAGKVGGHLNPIEINYAGTVNGATAQVIGGFDQGLNHYDCARMSLYDKASSSCFTTFFGGISQYHYDAASASLIQDTVNLNQGVDGLPFINSISTIQRAPYSQYSQVIQPVSLPYLLGTDTRFFPNSTLNAQTQIYSNGVIKLAGLKGRTLVGRLYGGIEAAGPYSGLITTGPATKASSRLFNVYVTPGSTPALTMPPIPTSTTPYPPPASNQ